MESTYSVCMPPKGGIHRLKRAFFGDFLGERECHCLDVIGERIDYWRLCPWKGVSLAKVSLIIPKDAKVLSIQCAKRDHSVHRLKKSMIIGVASRYVPSGLSPFASLLGHAWPNPSTR